VDHRTLLGIGLHVFGHGHLRKVTKSGRENVGLEVRMINAFRCVSAEAKGKGKCSATRGCAWRSAVLLGCGFAFIYNDFLGR
jgi:hypothetical protein